MLLPVKEYRDWQQNHQEPEEGDERTLATASERTSLLRLDLRISNLQTTRQYIPAVYRGPQPFGHQGLDSWEDNFPVVGRVGWAWLGMIRPKW